MFHVRCWRWDPSALGSADGGCIFVASASAFNGVASSHCQDSPAHDGLVVEQFGPGKRGHRGPEWQVAGRCQPRAHCERLL